MLFFLGVTWQPLHMGSVNDIRVCTTDSTTHSRSLSGMKVSLHCSYIHTQNPHRAQLLIQLPRPDLLHSLSGRHCYVPLFTFACRRDIPAQSSLLSKRRVYQLSCKRHMQHSTMSSVLLMTANIPSRSWSKVKLYDTDCDVSRPAQKAKSQLPRMY